MRIISASASSLVRIRSKALASACARSSLLLFGGVLDDFVGPGFSVF